MGSAHRAVSLPVVSAPPLSVRASGRAGPRPQAGPASADPGSMRLGLGWCEPRLAHRALRLWGAQGRPRFGAALQLPASCSESAGGACVRGAVSVDPSSRLPDIGFGLLRSGVSESSPALREGGASEASAGSRPASRARPADLGLTVDRGRFCARRVACTDAGALCALASAPRPNAPFSSGRAAPRFAHPLSVRRKDPTFL